MLRIFRKNKKKPGAVQDVQLRPAEQSGVDPLERRLEDTRRQLGKRLGALLTGRSSVDEDLLEEIETTLITSDIGVKAAMEIVENLRAGIRNKVISEPGQVLPAVQAELFELNDIGCPKTLVIDRECAEEVAAKLGLPCVLKKPDSSFSAGVVKADTEADLTAHLHQFLEESELVIAQEFAKSDFDWRVGVIDGKALYVCRYHMARGHWQIQKATSESGRLYGRTDTLAVEDAPKAVVELAVRASNLIGKGLYGVDIKEVDGRLLVMEVNDNPSIEAGTEDAILKDDLYLTIMQSIYDRLERRGQELR